MQVTDAVYRSMGFLLTLSGRTIQEPAQVEPRYAREAAEALDVFLAKVGLASFV